MKAHPRRWAKACSLASGAREIAAKATFALTQMGGDAVEVVGPERAALAADVPFGREHEVVDDELASIAEELRQRLGLFGPSNV